MYLIRTVQSFERKGSRFTTFLYYHYYYDFDDESRIRAKYNHQSKSDSLFLLHITVRWKIIGGGGEEDERSQIADIRKTKSSG